MICGGGKALGREADSDRRFGPSAVDVEPCDTPSREGPFANFVFMLISPFKSWRQVEGTLAEVPDYESYDYTREWRGKNIEDLAEKAIIEKWLVPAEYCLELGGGFGRITQVLLPHFKDVVMVDASVMNIRRARRRLGPDNIVRAEIGHLPFRGGQFDYVVAIRLIHHFPNLNSLFNEIRRVAKHGGQFILSTPNTSTSLRKVTRNREIGRGGPGHRIYVAPMSWYSSGFDVEARRGTGIFDNRLGVAVERFQFLYLLDVVTSPLWRAKAHVFLKLLTR